MIHYFEDIYNYNNFNKKFTRFGKVQWNICYTATSIIVNGRYMRLKHDLEHTYKLMTRSILSCYTPKELVKQMFEDWACTGFATCFGNKICHWVYTHGKEIKSMQSDTPLYRCKDFKQHEEFFCPTFAMAAKLTQDWYNEYVNTGWQYACHQSNMGVDRNGNDIMSNVSEYYVKDKEVNPVTIEAL